MRLERRYGDLEVAKLVAASTSKATQLAIDLAVPSEGKRRRDGRRRNFRGTVESSDQRRANAFEEEEAWPSEMDSAPADRAKTVTAGGASIYHGDALDVYDTWLPPSCIIADGPYGLGKFPGDPVAVSGLAEWYAPHVAAWSRQAEPCTTLWFWNSEIGWAKSHPVLELHGWHYEETVIWDKGIAHVAGNCNSKTIRGVPVVTEVAVRYTRRALLPTPAGIRLPVKEWVRAEWQRSGLPMNQSNEACGVANAATRKYLTQCHLWYFPPGDAIVAMADWCERYGRPANHPYFSLDGKHPPDARTWDRMRAKWTHTHALTNVWHEQPVHGRERVRGSRGYLHANQKPLALIERQILASTEPGDIVWEPFGGLCTATIAAARAGRTAYAAEINEEFFQASTARLHAAMNEVPSQQLLLAG